ncbi:uncharacterized protein LOC110865195 [Helianthus annuus]|uniref:uncharacterized protein LOC110865195 n=1 Tax=Helianthus annuus TaxID=4232 RepID=UPI000B8FA887|nr:uncharacterized protein LOC110865195 [Helianthus annuus]
MDDRSKPGGIADGVLHDRGKPPESLKDFTNVPLSVDGAEYLNEPVVEELSTPGTAPIRGIGLRVTNIEGNPLIPRRGMFSTSNASVLDGLMSISKPVENLFAAGASSSTTSKDDTAGQCHETLSFANVVQRNKADVKVNFRSLETSEKQDGCDVVLSRESVRVVHDKLANTLYGYFLGDRVAFPVVDYFVRNNWKRYGLQKSMMNATAFSSSSLLIKQLEKKEVKKVQVWVKFHEVPLAAYTEDGLSLIATTIGVPKALDSFTTSMCVDVWGRSSYARALVEISADSELKEELTIAVPCLDGDGFVKEKVYVEYEWCPHRCGRCCVFGHTHENCPLQAPRVSKDKKQQHKGPGYDRKMKQPVQDPGPSKRQPTVDDDGYTTVLGKKAAKKVGFNVNKPKPKFEYRPVSTNRKDNGKSKSESTNVVSRNPFDVLNEVNEEQGQRSKSAGDGNEDSDEDEVMEGYCEMDDFLMEGTHKVQGASTPSPVVSNANYYVTRRELWYRLSKHKVLVGNNPWVILGDFNSALNLDDKSMGVSNISAGMREFQDCISEIEVFDINSSGLHYTWSQKPKKGAGLLKKIDRVLGNTPFVDSFPNSVAFFHPYRLSDHCPCLLKIPKPGKSKHRPFKFANFLVYKPGFLKTVKKAWDTNIEGVLQFRVVKKLRLLKNPLRALLFQQGNLHKKVEVLRSKLDAIQRDIDSSPLNVVLCDQEIKISAEFQEACLDEERFLKQKSKVDWLRAGDANTAFFHASLKCRNHSTRIDVITNSEGVMFEGENVSKAIVTHYEKFLGSEDAIAIRPTQELFSKRLNDDDALHMIRPVMSQEVKLAMFSIGNDKAPGPDGFSAAFFKSAWDIIGLDVSNAIIDFFNTGKLLRELNNTLIVLIPKKATPYSVTDYRPIACCNVIYKCISKIVADRIKGSLNQIVSINQSAFIPGRKISDNILLTQELMHNYHRSYGPPRCAFKVDIQKAYDTVHWGFLKDVLVGFGFNPKMVEWIMICVSTPSYSLCVNGEVHGYFRGRRGLRQGDPLSPYLFTLVMEILTCILQHGSRLGSSFKFHNRCEKQRIINLCFADDLFLFARGDVHSASFIMESLTQFTNMSGLVPSIQKSTAFFCNVSDLVKEAILNVLPFEEGSLPVRYLGVPLISTRLLAKDCDVLVERMEKRIANWKNKLLSFAGRLQLIISVLAALHVYWSSVFILPASIIKDLEAKMRNFLWSQEASFHRGKAKVSWSSICVPKYEGGLGIRRVGDVNKALMASHAWSILNKRDSLWVAWIYSYRLKHHNFWTCREGSNCSWSWRKLLHIRPLLRSHIWSKLGNGNDTSAWYDLWSQLGPLTNLISARVITNAGFRLNDKVADVFLDTSWAWPEGWRSRFPMLDQLDNIRLNPNSTDRLCWKEGDVTHDFSSSIAWHSVRSREQEIDWVNLVWFPQCIPRHAFLMWLIMRRKLLTQDIILQWDISRRKNMNMMCCLLCYENVDSHEHLFFECSFSSKIWLMVREKAGMARVDPKWSSIIGWLKARGSSKSAALYVSKLLVGATAYVIWQERNARLFRNQTRPPDTIRDTILKTIRYKLMGAKFRQCINVTRLRDEWGIAEETVNDDGG